MNMLRLSSITLPYSVCLRCLLAGLHPSSVLSSPDRCNDDALLPLLLVFMVCMTELTLLRPLLSSEGDGAPGAGEAEVEALLLWLPPPPPPFVNVLESKALLELLL